MPVRTLLLVLLIVLIAGFVAINWAAFTAPTTLSFVFATVAAPLGLIMLGLLVACALAFAIYMAVWQGRILMESRRNAKELQAQRTLADQAEASRFTELRNVMHDELQRLSQTLRAEIHDSTNSLAASIGELDDRLHGSAGDSPTRPG